MPRSAPVALRGDVKVSKSFSRTWAAAGVALAGASILAVAPVVHSEVPTAYKATEATVRLAADWKPLEPYIEAFNTASKNAATLADNYFLAPGLPLQQVIVNQARYLNEVLNDPSKADDVLKEMRANLESVIAGVTGIGATGDTLDTMKNHSVDGGHGLILQLLPSFLPAGGAVDPDLVSAIVTVLASPMSGVLMGLVGPVISPAVAVLNSGIAIAAAIQAGDPDAVFSDVLSAPADVIGSVFNGATLDLTALAPFINDTGLLGGTKINTLDVAFGGLFTPGSIGRGKYEGSNGTEITAPGGSILNSVGMKVTTDALGLPFTIRFDGQAVGPIGAMQGLGQTVGALLGDGWDGKSGKAIPPLSGLQFPTVSDDAAANWAAAIEKLAHTLLGDKNSSTAGSDDNTDTDTDTDKASTGTAGSDKSAASAVVATTAQADSAETTKAREASAGKAQTRSVATDEAGVSQQDTTGQSAGATTPAATESPADTSPTTPPSTPESSAPSTTDGEKSTGASESSTPSDAGASSTSGSATGAASTGTSDSSGEASATSSGASSSSPSGSTSTGGSTSSPSGGSGDSSARS